MPVTTQKYVELFCALPLEGVLPPLCYNLFLIVICSIYAFKARTLPDNFNESRYIYLSTATTVFLWLAFIPTYFSAFYAYQKALLLSCILLLNSTVMLICLYLPKLYAIFYIDEETLHIQGTMVTNVQSTNMRFSGGGTTNKVTPVETVTVGHM